MQHLTRPHMDADMAVVSGNYEQQEVELLYLSDQTPARGGFLPPRNSADLGMVAIAQILGGVIRQFEAFDLAIDQHRQTPAIGTSM